MISETNTIVCLNTTKSTKNEPSSDVKQEKSDSSDLVHKISTSEVDYHEFDIEPVTTHEQNIIHNDYDKSEMTFSTKPRKFNLLADYSAYSTIHGVRYFSDSERHWSER